MLCFVYVFCTQTQKHKIYCVQTQKTCLQKNLNLRLFWLNYYLIEIIKIIIQSKKTYIQISLKTYFLFLCFCLCANYNFICVFVCGFVYRTNTQHKTQYFFVSNCLFILKSMIFWLLKDILALKTNKMLFYYIKINMSSKLIKIIIFNFVQILRFLNFCIKIMKIYRIRYRIK